MFSAHHYSTVSLFFFLRKTSLGLIVAHGFGRGLELRHGLGGDVSATVRQLDLGSGPKVRTGSSGAARRRTVLLVRLGRFLALPPVRSTVPQLTLEGAVASTIAADIVGGGCTRAAAAVHREINSRSGLVVEEEATELGIGLVFSATAGVSATESSSVAAVSATRLATSSALPSAEASSQVISGQ